MANYEMKSFSLAISLTFLCNQSRLKPYLDHFLLMLIEHRLMKREFALRKLPKVE